VSEQLWLAIIWAKYLIIILWLWEIDRRLKKLEKVVRSRE
jgi:hypothetical protein